MTGRVNARREAVLRLRVCGRGQARRSLVAIIDTGYDGSLTLPPATIRSLGLRRIGQSYGELGDGSIVTFDVYAGTVMWNGRWRPVEIDEARTDPLIGMALLDGYEVNIRVEPSGAVRVRRL
jgi:clan AA aspartic protease